MQKIYDWMMKKADTPFAVWLLGLLSFAESSVSPIPPDPLLIPMIIGRPKRAWFFASICAITSVLGALVGYAIGLYFFELWGMKILEFYHLVPAFEKLKGWFHEWGGLIILAKALTPIPFKVVTITCGAIQFNVWTFILASLVSRSARFFLEAALFRKYGDRLNHWLRKHATKLTLLLTLVLLLGFLILFFIGD